MFRNEWGQSVGTDPRTEKREDCRAARRLTFPIDAVAIKERAGICQLVIGGRTDRGRHGCRYTRCLTGRRGCGSVREKKVTDPATLAPVEIASGEMFLCEGMGRWWDESGDGWEPD